MIPQANFKKNNTIYQKLEFERQRVLSELKVLLFYKISNKKHCCWLVPAICMSFAVDKTSPKVLDEKVEMKYGARVMIGLFLLTIITAVSFHNFLHLPPAAGMMLGLGYLDFFSYHIKRKEGRIFYYDNILGARNKSTIKRSLSILQDKTHAQITEVLNDLPTPAFILNKEHVITHWNPAMAVLTGVSAKDKIGTRDQWKFFYPQERLLLADMVLESGSKKLINKFYHGKNLPNKSLDSAYEVSDFDPSLGEKGRWLYFASAPLKNPVMSHGQWLLVTMTAGVGGSLLSIGSAAGVALMGSARGIYTFGTHFKWMPVIMLGYAASILVHLFINSHLM